jgi:O-antigen/teichoic acid export membrane protein
VRSGLLTGISTAAVSGSAAVLGVILSRKFGHGVKTDGFFAAYGPYLALVLVAGSLRVVVLPRFVTARSGGELGREVGSWAAGLAGPLAAIVLAALLWPHGIASVLTSAPGAQHTAAILLPWVVPSAVAQIFGGLVASGLAALDDYEWAAFGFAFGSVAGVVLTLLLIGHGVVALGWGLALNGALTLAIPLGALVVRRGIGWPAAVDWSRLVQLGEGVALPVALQVLYVVGLRFASGLGEGRGTTFSYAYLIAAFLVAVTAASVALVATVPFAREGAAPERVARHVVSISWLSLAVVAAAAGVFALAGETVVRRVLGSSYAGGTGAELGRLVVYLAPWMVASAAFSIVYPLLFVMHRTRFLVPLAAAAVLLDVPISIAARAWGGLTGVAVALGISTLLLVLGLMAALGSRVLVPSAIGLARLSLVVLAAAALAFGGASLLLAAVPAAVLGVVLYTAILVVIRELGLAEAWQYVRALH